MMPGKKQFPISAATSNRALSTSNKLPLAEKETAPTPFSDELPQQIETVPEYSLQMLEELPQKELYINLKLPPEVAILHVYSQGDQSYSVWGGNQIVPLKSTPSKPSPILSLGNSVKKPESPENIKFTLSVFSRTNLELRKWLKQLRQKFKEKLSLVIVDHTDYEIPWEAIELSPGESPNEYLGALITTVRWRQVIQGDDYLVLEIKSDLCDGNTVAYLLDSELDVNAELTVLEQLQSVIYRSSSHNNCIQEFHNHLKTNDCDCALVYFACHGTFKGNIHEITLGSDRNTEQQLKLQSMYDQPLNLLKKSQAIVFINACHSGREQIHPAIPSHYPLGFIDLFLTKGARGVIGTLGAVGNQYATLFAHDLMRESLNSPDLPVAAIIRNLRANVIKKLSNEPTQEDLLSFIYTFMYVYYGNPMTVLRLTQTGGNPDV